MPFLGKYVGLVTGRKAVSGKDPLLKEAHSISSFSRAVGKCHCTSALSKHFAILSACTGEGLAKISLDNSTP